MQSSPFTTSHQIEGDGAPSSAAPTLLSRLVGLVAPPTPPASADFAARERARRGRLAGVLLLAFTLIELAALVQFTVVDDDHPYMKVTLVVCLLLTVVVGALNRLGWNVAAALLLVALADLPLAAIPATAIGGRFDTVDLGALYLAAGSLLVAASVLEPWSVFIVAALNCALMAALMLGMPHTEAFNQLLASNNAQQAFAGPLLMQAVVALVAFFWARSVLMALRRADRAEEIAALQQREAQRTHDLEQGVRELLAAHVQIANGNFQARVPAIRNPLLWQIGSSLNNLMARFGRLAQMEFLLRRTEQEAHRLAESIRMARAGGRPLWPAPTGAPLDEVITALTDAPPPAPPPSHGAHAPDPAAGQQLGAWPFA